MASVTEGWDLVAVINQSTLNALFASAYSGDIPVEIPNGTIPEFNASFSGFIGMPTVDLTPTSASGSNTFAAMTFPLSGTMTTGPVSTPLAPGANIMFTSNLTYVNVEESSETTQLQLTLDWTSDEILYNVRLSGLSQILDDFLSAGLLTTLQAKLGSSGSFHLGSVSIASVPAVLQPSGMAKFAIQPNATSPADNVLAMVTMTNSRPMPVDPPDFTQSGPLLPPSHNSALYISNAVLLEGLLGPAMAAQLSIPNWTTTGSPAEGYTLSFAGAQVINATASGISKVEVTNVGMSVNGSGQVAVTYQANAYPTFDIQDGYWVQINGSMTLEPVLSNNSISFTVSTPTPTGSIQATLATRLIVVAAIMVSFGTLSGFFAGILGLCLFYILTYISFPVTALGNLSSTIQNSMRPFQWPAAQAYPLSAIVLPGDLVLYGSPAGINPVHLGLRPTPPGLL